MIFQRNFFSLVTGLLSFLSLCTLLLGSVLVTDSAAGNRVGRAQECRLVVGEKEFISGDCPAIIHERGGITVGSNGAGGEMMSFWAYIFSENGSTGRAFFNGSSGNKYAQVDLGPAESHGWCWLAPDAEICLKGFTELDLGQEDAEVVKNTESTIVASSKNGDRVGRAQKCRLVVGDKELISGGCPVAVHEVGGDDIGNNGVGGESLPFWARIISDDGKTGVAYYNGEAGSTHAHYDLGPVSKVGSCWRGANVEICYENFTELDLGSESNTLINTISSSESPLECGLIDKFTIECSVHDDTAQVTDVVLNRGRCVSPIATEEQKRKVKDWLGSLDQRQRDAVAISPEFVKLMLLGGGRGDIADAVTLVYNNPIKTYGFGDKFKIVNTCENLLEFTITVNGSDWTWDIGR